MEQVCAIAIPRFVVAVDARQRWSSEKPPDTGRYPVTAEGIPYWPPATDGGMVHKPIEYLVAIAALALAVFGLLTSLAATPDGGVGFNDMGTIVTEVLPGSPAWRDGIRPGDAILELHDSTAPGGWELLVRDAGVTLGSSAADQEARLRETLPWALAGLAIVVTALLLLLRTGVTGLALVPIGVTLAATPLLRTGNPRDLLVGGAGTFLLAGAAVALVAGRRRSWPLAVGLGLSLGALWIASILAVPGAFDPVDLARIPVAGTFTVWGGAMAIDRRRLRQRLLAPGGPSAFDLLYLPVVVAILLGGLAFVRLSPLVAAAILVAAVVLYPTTRRTTGASVERLIIGNVRRQAEIRAIEDERGRLARDIHDAPLQELAAVIRRLEARPDTAGETTALREVAAQLRDVATTLHPPVLEDLGLAPALADLADGLAAAHPDRLLRVEVVDLTGAAARPPTDVETAGFRIAQEATANAIRHGGGRSVSILGSVSTDAIELTIADDGPGIDRDAAAAARRRGHFGLDSMRERADAVGGTVTIDSDATGVRVRFTWERSR